MGLVLCVFILLLFGWLYGLRMGGLMVGGIIEGLLLLQSQGI